MSSQSDFLPPDVQNFLLAEMEGDNMDNLNFFKDEPTLNDLNYSNILNGSIVANDDSKMVHLIFPGVQTSVPSNDEYDGPYEFEVDVHPTVAKNSWVYSTTLNKVYMTMGSPFPVDFRVSHRPPNPLFIRSTPVYSAPQFAQECVYRCLNHEFSHKESDGDLKEHIRPHIIRCANQYAAYLGDKSKNERLSVVIPFGIPQTGTESVREIFEFVCKNSCPSPGMNRRAVEIIFTLEDNQGTIYGRKTLNVRICSCPKRDKEKDEKDNTANTNLPHGKKRKMEKPSKKPMQTQAENDTKEFTLTIPLVGRHNEQNVLKYCHDLMAGEILRNIGNGTEGPYKIALNKINTLIRESSE
ncbi:cellular tumor antigen p53 [Leptinotarsa decemlineata]|uniref:cellular tumor antigen p53 n=1 Tax=Leptinotarsa decemlineata TaxID=7539 RepID=UPI000C253B67|nr:cellular tumor antigen p53 [Leptinotarsa decemlineata]XP_023024881.1 cellular tumor antigen p53 [Leptinotarsa decemlineata]